MRLPARKPAPFLLLLLVALPLALHAKSTDRQAPMDINAGHTDAYMTDDGTTTLSQGVEITQGTLQVRSDSAVLHRKGGELSEIVLTGSPATLKQVNDNGEPINAQAARIVYTLGSDVVVLTGAVVIEQPRGTLRGETIRYDLASGRLNGGGDGSRVQMRIMPRSAPPAPATPAPATGGAH